MVSNVSLYNNSHQAESKIRNIVHERSFQHMGDWEVLKHFKRCELLTVLFNKSKENRSQKFTYLHVTSIGSTHNVSSFGNWSSSNFNPDSSAALSSSGSGETRFTRMHLTKKCKFFTLSCQKLNVLC